MSGGGHDEPGAGSAPPAQPQPREGKSFEFLLKARYLAVPVVVLSLLHALAFLFVGAQIAVKTYGHILLGGPPETAARPGLELLHSLDLLMISLVLIILAVGVAKLFLSPRLGARSTLPEWLNIETFGDLKYVLWETILTALLIIGLSILVSGLNTALDWTALVVPAAILMLSVSFYLMKRA